MSDLLMHITHATQLFFEANCCRFSNEQLRRAYPDGAEGAQEAMQRYAKNVEKYNRLTESAKEECRIVERSLAARSFRLPDRVSRKLSLAKIDLFNLGKAVNDGRFMDVTLFQVKMEGHIATARAFGRGWRLADPFEWIKLRLPKKAKRTTPRFDLDEGQMARILELVHKRATSQSENTFTVHPPKKLIDSPTILESDSLVDELEHSIFELVFQDGTYQMISLVELVVFTYQLVVVREEFARIAAMGKLGMLSSGPVEITVKTQFTTQDLMQTELVKFLLSKIEFSDSPSDSD